MIKVVSSEEMRNIDRACVARGLPTRVLMENAGRAVAKETRRFLGSVKGKNIICLCGGGNNGGDGLVAARYLHEYGARVNVFLCSSRDAADDNLKLLVENGISYTDLTKTSSLDGFMQALGETDCVIDAVLGTGRSRPIEGLLKDVLITLKIEREKRSLIVVAVDLPSGMNADTGACDTACPTADLTVTLAFPKPGLFGYPGAEKVGKLVISNIGIPVELARNSKLELMDDEFAEYSLPHRPRTANKGTFGKVLIVAGSVNYTGAAFLACSGALRIGAGLVTLASARSLHHIIASRLAEATHLPLPESPPGYIAEEAAPMVNEACSRYSVILAGCGLAQMPSTAAFIRSLLSESLDIPCVLDADALNILSTAPNQLNSLPIQAILTPHPGEMSRLTGLTIAEIQADRIGTARNFARTWEKIIVLKGAHTVIASPDGQCRISPFANSVLATGGTGDVLAGIIAGLVAQGLSLFDAASLGVYLHGATGEHIYQKIGNAGILASDLLPELPVTIKEFRNQVT